jgi:hypothetical protein
MNDYLKLFSLKNTEIPENGFSKNTLNKSNDSFLNVFSNVEISEGESNKKYIMTELQDFKNLT